MEGEDNHHQHKQDPNNTDSDSRLKVKKEYYCAPCKKWFSSGKALGGHMSSAHVQAHREYSYKSKHCGGDLSCFVEHKEMSCPICGKGFPSTKSLFGHMRCHPDRAYRGMEPPLRAKNTKAKDNRSQSHSQQYSGEEKKVETHNNIVDLRARLWSWTATDKRGRSPIKRRMRTAAGSSTSTEEDEEERQLYEAVRQLVSLGNGNPNPSPNPQIGEKRNGIVIAGLALNHDDYQPDEDRSGDEDGDSNKKKRRIDEFSPGSSGGGRGRFKCSDCSKSFDSHQALGGHKSSHNKFKLSIQNDCPNQHHSSNIIQSNDVVTPLQIEASNTDDAPSCSAPVGGYECGVCQKIFPTRRAHGGHKKCHNNHNNNAQSSDSAPVQQQQQQQQQEQQNDDHHHRILDFDLNEIPESTNNNNVDDHQLE